MGWNPRFRDAAFQVGVCLAERGISLIYGGAKVGLMGALADGALAYGGEVIGVLPRFLGGKEIAHAGLADLIIVDSMHERKLKMDQLSDGAIGLPGGYGTLEEFFEALTWAQLGLHEKPVALLNVEGFFDPVVTLVQSMVDEGFLKPTNQQMLLVDDDIGRLLDRMGSYEAPEVEKWIRSATT